MPVMVYRPVEQRRLDARPALAEVTKSIGATAAQVALAWRPAPRWVVAISKAATVAHVRENRAAADLVLLDGDLAVLDVATSRPCNRRPLEML